MRIERIGEATLYTADILEALRSMADESVHRVMTSPPYWGLRDYGQAGQIGLEPTPEEYVARMVEVFREVRRVLRADGTCWVNLGDSYASGLHGQYQREKKGSVADTWDNSRVDWSVKKDLEACGLKPKDMCGIPWLVAKALQAPYYNGRIKDERDRVWMAATIDAEGSICGFTHERKDDGSIRTGIHLTITNTSIALLDNAFRIWPTSREEHNMHGEGHLGSADTFRWIPHGVEEKSQLLREIYPYLIAKKKQAVLAWNFLEMSKVAKHSARTVEAESIKEKRAWIVDSLSKLNHFQDIDIPSWCKDPPSCYEPGWYLRSDIIWAKKNCMPESVTDRPTKAHEYLFLLSKSPRYFYDGDAVREPYNPNSPDRYNYRIADTGSIIGKRQPGKEWNPDYDQHFGPNPAGRNRRTVWTIATQPYTEAHFATFPEKLVEPCVLAGCPAQVCPECGAPWERVVEKSGGTTVKSWHDHSDDLGKGQRKNESGMDTYRVSTLGFCPTCAHDQPPVPGTFLDPFCGSGTALLVALRLGRRAVGIELKPEYMALTRKRIAGEAAQGKLL